MMLVCLVNKNEVLIIKKKKKEKRVLSFPINKVLRSHF
jgi:hypothetical protein